MLCRSNSDRTVEANLNFHSVTVVLRSLHTPLYFPIECQSKQVVQNIVFLDAQMHQNFQSLMLIQDLELKLSLL